jgi:hypothetical protein
MDWNWALVSIVIILRVIFTFVDYYYPMNETNEMDGGTELSPHPVYVSSLNS